MRAINIDALWLPRTPIGGKIQPIQRAWCNGNTSAFQAVVTGSNPVARSSPLGPVAQRQSGRLITGWSQVRILSGPQTSPEKGFCCTPRATAQWFNLLLSSPPRVWGKRHLVERESVGTAVHPHACGENGMSVSYSEHADGSPPRVWGKLFDNGQQLDDKFGSPPRVWGKLSCQRRRAAHGRFTPTRVGKTLVEGGANIDSCGSPPRVWGKPTHEAIRRLATGFTPTRVGKTGNRRYTLSLNSVHPHACGENW